MRVKKGTPMGEVFKQYAEKKGLQEKSLSFVARRAPGRGFQKTGEKKGRPPPPTPPPRRSPAGRRSRTTPNPWT